MRIKNLKALLMSLTITIGVYSVCPTFMHLQSKDFGKKVAELNKKPTINSQVRTLAVLENK